MQDCNVLYKEERCACPKNYAMENHVKGGIAVV